MMQRYKKKIRKKDNNLLIESVSIYENAYKLIDIYHYAKNRRFTFGDDVKHRGIYLVFQPKRDEEDMEIVNSYLLYKM